jgi:hypothetical protein
MPWEQGSDQEFVVVRQHFLLRESCDIDQWAYKTGGMTRDEDDGRGGLTFSAPTARELL